ncbi:helix-turn-helix transcriptional regulator [Phascolarctobacterium sp.]|uniref:helix-turn-helix domain-containing protein n=1 Tax=Phascolarctobacterium sp. TaxID=2049039 RepID=UPI00304DE621
MYQIGKKIRRFREQKGISQKDFASAIGQSNAKVSNWERGLNRPDVDMLTEICKVLGVSSDELLDITIAPQGISEKEKKVIRAYREKVEIRHAVDILLGINE